MLRTLVCIAAAVLLPAALAAPPAGAVSGTGGSCSTGALVDATFRDAGLAALRRLTVDAPGQSAHGAVRVHQSPGYIDAQGQPWHHVSAYAVNLGFIGALRVSPDLKATAGRWLEWQARHMATTGNGPTRGVVLDHWLRAGDLAESTCPPGIAPALCNEVDAFDSTAASTLLLAYAYVLYTGDAMLLRQPHVRPALEAAAGALARLTQPNGLTWAKPSYPVSYAMDAVEVLAGWRAWAAIQRDVYSEPQSAIVSLDFVRRGEHALRSRLWNPQQRLWRVAADAPVARLDRWYPDTVAQAWPLLWNGFADPELALRSRVAWDKAARAWGGANGWAVRNVDPAGFWWPAVAVAAHCTGDTESARTWVRRARARWLAPEEPFAWPFQVSDLLWLFWLAEPQSPAAVDPVPPPGAMPVVSPR